MGGSDDATKQLVQNLKSEVAKLEEIIQVNSRKVAALEKELITEKGKMKPNWC